MKLNYLTIIKNVMIFIFSLAIVCLAFEIKIHQNGQKLGEKSYLRKLSLDCVGILKSYINEFYYLVQADTKNISPEEVKRRFQKEKSRQNEGVQRDRDIEPDDIKEKVKLFLKNHPQYLEQWEEMKKRVKSRNDPRIAYSIPGPKVDIVDKDLKTSSNDDDDQKDEIDSQSLSDEEREIFDKKYRKMKMRKEKALERMKIKLNF